MIGRVAGALALLVLATVMRVHADSGYFAGTTGARAAGRGGAFTAKADDITALLFNPAGLSRIEGTLIQAGNRFSYNVHRFERAPTLDWGNTEGGVPPYVEFDPVHNERPLQLLEPLLGVASDLGLRDVGVGLAAYAPAGVGRQEFPIDGAQRYMMVSREAVIVGLTGGAGIQLGDRFGFGASVQWIAAPRVAYELVIDANQFPGDVHPVSSELDMLGSVSGSDPFALNARVGVWYRPVSFLELALSGQVIPSEIRTESTLEVEPLSAHIEDEVVLRRRGRRASDVALTLPLPLEARFAIRYLHFEGAREVFDLELDLNYESWSRVERFVVDGDDLIAHLFAQRVDVGRIEIDKRWRDTLGVRLGGDYAVAPDRLILRGGAFYTSALSAPSHAHVDFVSGARVGGALGVSVFVLGLELALAYQYIHQPARSVPESRARVYQEAPASQCAAPYTQPDRCHPQYRGQPAPAVNAGTYHAHFHASSLDVLYRF